MDVTDVPALEKGDLLDTSIAAADRPGRDRRECNGRLT